MLVKLEDQDEVSSLHDQFDKLDSDGTGLISKVELKKAVSECSLGIPEDKLDDIIDEVDYFGHHQISYTEFLAATL